jgi:hypothetical protein
VPVNVVPTAGYAILVQGQIDGGEGAASHHKTAGFVYDILRQRGILDGVQEEENDIKYLSPISVETRRDGDATLANIEDAVKDWAFNKMKDNPGDLYVILLDHGWTAPGDPNEGLFYLHPDDPLTSTELGEWINYLETSLDSTDAHDRNIVVILGFCRGAAFLPVLSPQGSENLVVIASAAADEYSHRGPRDVDKNGQPLRDGEYFVTEFFKQVALDKSIAGSFERATALTEAFTSSGDGEGTVNAPYFDDSHQHPLIEDNGDGTGSNTLTGLAGEDGTRSRELYIGVNTGTNAAGDVVVTRTASARFIGTAETSTAVWAEVNDPVEVSLIWLEVKDPGYDLGDLEPAPGVQIEMETFDRPTTEVAGSRYLWNDLGGGTDPEELSLFDEPGAYQVLYFAKDKDTGNVSPLMRSTVYKDRPDNAAPNSFELLLPLYVPPDGQIPEMRTDVLLDWTDTNDPDMEAITFTVMISTDAGFTDPIRIENLTYSNCLLTENDGIEDDTDYWWKVRAIDPYGQYYETDVWRFSTDNPNDPRCWVQVHLQTPVPGQSEGEPVNEAVVTANGVVLNPVGGDYAGYYLGSFEVAAGVHWPVTVTADGFSDLPPTSGECQVTDGNVPQAVLELWLNTAEDSVATPVFDPVPGSYVLAPRVELSTATENATIRYTLDGSEPTEEGSPEYTQALILPGSVTVNAKAFKDGATPSGTADGTYTVSIKTGDVNGDGALNESDADLVLEVVSGAVVEGVYLDADVNGDGVIGKEEAVYIFEKLNGLRAP